MKNKVFIIILILLLITCLFACKDREPVQGIVVDKCEKAAWTQPIIVFNGKFTYTTIVQHPHRYVLYIDMDGETVSVTVSSEVYETYNIGDSEVVGG